MPWEEACGLCGWRTVCLEIKVLLGAGLFLGGNTLASICIFPSFPSKRLVVRSLFVSLGRGKTHTHTHSFHIGRWNSIAWKVTHSVVSNSFVTPWTVAYQTLSMRFSRQEYWSRLPFPSPGDLPNPGIEPRSSVSPALQVDFLPSEPTGKPMACLTNIVWRNEFKILNKIAQLRWKISSITQCISYEY